MLHACFEFAQTNHLRVIFYDHRHSMLLPFISILGFEKKSLYTVKTVNASSIYFTIRFWEQIIRHSQCSWQAKLFFGYECSSNSPSLNFVTNNTSIVRTHVLSTLASQKSQLPSFGQTKQLWFSHYYFRALLHTRFPAFHLKIFGYIKVPTILRHVKANKQCCLCTNCLLLSLAAPRGILASYNR